MNRPLRFLVHLLIVGIYGTVLPETNSSIDVSSSFSQSSSNQRTTKSTRESPSSAQKSRKSRSQESSKKKSASQESSSSKTVSRARAYFNRAKKKLKAKNYEGALQDFQRSEKLHPNKTTKSYIAKLGPIVKKRAAARPEKSVASAERPAKSERGARQGGSVPVQPKSIYEVSDNIYRLTHELDNLVERMGKAQQTLKPLDRGRRVKEEGERLERAEKRATDEPGDGHTQRELALAYERKGFYAKAKDIYLRLIATDPTNSDYHFYLGSLFSRMGQSQNARFAYEEALEISPDHRATLDALSYLADDADGGDMARELIQKASHLEPEGPAHLMKEVREQLSSGSFQDAISLVEEARQRFPSNSVFPFLQGQAHEATGDLENAKKSYRLSMTLNRIDSSPAMALADLYFDQGNYLYAAVTYESALTSNPRDTDLRFKQGLSYFRAFEWGKASSAWEDLLRYAPGHQEVRNLLPQVYYVLSLEYNRNGFSDLSRRSFANALAVNPRSEEWIEGALKTAGEYYRGSGLFRNALGAYQDAIDIDPSDAENYTGLGVTYWYMGEREMAVAAWQKSLNLQPEDNSARGWLILANRGPGS
ncbi:MAG: tetratricopeptide repeat protein [Candidatus Neomarinimicrobiota bacterium]